MRTGIALGSNLGDRLHHLREAIGALRALHRPDEPLLISRVYETEPVDCAPGDPAFLNAVVEIENSLSPLALLDALQALEHTAGRPAVRPPNTPRALDLDLLYHGDFALHWERLDLPHPRLTERRFVLAPLCDIRPQLQLPGWPACAAELLARLPLTPRVTIFPASL